MHTYLYAAWMDSITKHTKCGNACALLRASTENMAYEIILNLDRLLSIESYAYVHLAQYLEGKRMPGTLSLPLVRSLSIDIHHLDWFDAHFLLKGGGGRGWGHMRSLSPFSISLSVQQGTASDYSENYISPFRIHQQRQRHPLDKTTHIRNKDSSTSLGIISSHNSVYHTICVSGFKCEHNLYG